jgi:hypothetical protein
MPPFLPREEGRKGLSKEFGQALHVILLKKILKYTIISLQ